MTTNKSNQQRILTDDKIITVSTSVDVQERVIDWEDIDARIEYDDYNSEAPWESCDGFEHNADTIRHRPSEWEGDPQGYVYSSINREWVHITIDDQTVIHKWGLPEWTKGASKQVIAEYVARVKAQTIDQLARWYADGWQWYGAIAEYPAADIRHSVWGIDSEDYARKMAETELRHEVCAKLESAGFIVENKPAAVSGYNRVDVMRDRIRRNLAG